MGKQCTKSADNPYCQARKKAAVYNPKLNSREGAAEFLNISPSSVSEYELGLCKVVPVDKVIIMADGYNAPELLNHYCRHECPIGRDLPVSEKPIELVTLKLMNTLENSEDMRKALMQIAEDGIISEDEKGQFDGVMKYFDQLKGIINDLALIGAKCRKE